MDSILLAAIIGALAGVVGTYLGAILKVRKDLEFEYDKSLREKRIVAYQALWKLTGAFPRYAIEKPTTYGDLRKLTASLRDWYFETGGVFLTDASRDAYFALQKALTPLTTGAEPDAAELWTDVMR